MKGYIAEVHREGDFDIEVSGRVVTRPDGTTEVRCIGVATRKVPFLQIRTKRAFSSAAAAVAACRACIATEPSV